MQRSLAWLVTAAAVAGCAPGYTRAEYVYAQPAQYVYVVPVDRVVVVTQEVLVNRGWAVFRVQQAGPNRIIWARRGDDEVVRIFATPQGERVVVRGLWEARRKRGDHDERREDDDHDRGEHRGWEQRGEPHDIIADIDVRLRAR
ncbi:MAG TPA: hypothetical protein VKQ05_13295 [Gemmatimonadales bacterium]|nr:hypothetical protein [Gemmatimonadales bacterium]